MDDLNSIDKGKLFLALLSDFSVETYSEDLKQYYNFIERYLPDYLYKYFAISEYSIRNIIHNDACFTNPNLFNDLFDSGANLSRKGAKERLYDINNVILKLKSLKKSNNEINKIYQELEESNFFNDRNYRNKLAILRQILCKEENLALIRTNHILSGIKIKTEKIYSNTGDPNTNRLLGDIADNVRVLCLSESENNTLMWAHYGQNDSGICIKYSKKNILDFLNSRDDIFILPVCYMNKTSGFEHITLEESPLELLRHFMIKKEDWRYENEWRLVKYCPNYSYNPLFYRNFVAALSAPCSFPDYYNINFIEPEAIYLGVKFDINNLNNGELKQYQTDFLSYVEHYYSKFKYLSVCEPTLGYCINSL